MTLKKIMIFKNYLIFFFLIRKNYFKKIEILKTFYYLKFKSFKSNCLST